MALAQHHGLPTRLLDWTTNPLVALFFAVENTSAEFEAQVYKGKVYDEQIYDYKETTSAVGRKEPFKFYMPTYVDRRLEAQSSCFTLHPLIEFSNKDAYFEHFADMLPKELSLTRCVVPTRYFGMIKAELNEIGISYKTMFPGLDGLCKSLRYKNSGDIERLLDPMFF